MNVSFKELQRKDEEKVIKFASEGMHLSWFVKNHSAQHISDRLYWYSCAFKATQIIAAYEEDRFLGVLAASIYGEKSCYHNPLGRILSKLISPIISLFELDDDWNDICYEMYNEYTKDNSPDGEILFFVTSPNVRGIGSLLLSEFRRRNNGKIVFLYTDEGCNYGFYDHVGFKRMIEKSITLKIRKKTRNLKCFLYCARL
ncbi:MAG: GNAT family N-acetyltransferase [archaeon]|nr:GNAT family N-acetyltransferase [archaeon]